MAITAGVDLEWAVVELVRAHQGKLITIPAEYSNTVKTQARKCNTHLFNVLGEQFDIYHSDEAIPGLPKISGKPEPKTDIVVQKDTLTYYISVKMDGKIQLSSGQGRSTAELFESAANVTGETSDEFKAMMTELRHLPTRLLALGNLARILNENNPDIVNEFTQDGQIIETKSYDIWNKNHKNQLLTSLLSYTHTHDNFFLEVLREALTGKQTLKDYPGAAATHILSPRGFYVIDDAYLEKVKQKVFMDIRAKSRRGITSVTFRLETAPV